MSMREDLQKAIDAVAHYDRTGVQPTWASEAMRTLVRNHGQELLTAGGGDSATLTQLIAMFRQREQVGLAKYGTTVDRADLSLRDWLQHALEESMDKSLYLLRAIETAGAPEGWKLVPVKPTREMMDAVVPRSSQDQTGRIQALVWAAMLEAAPEVPRG